MEKEIPFGPTEYFPFFVRWHIFSVSKFNRTKKGKCIEGGQKGIKNG
jgi:hypothetical protein